MILGFCFLPQFDCFSAQILRLFHILKLCFVHSAENHLEDMKNIVAMFKKLNPLAKEFFSSYYNNTKKNNHTGKDNQIMPAGDFVAKKNQSGEEFDHDLKKDDNNRKV